jgi:hypothetical protein
MTRAAAQFSRICFHALLMTFSGIALAQDEIGSPAAGNVVMEKFSLKASQGVAVDENWFYAISNIRISKHEKQSGKLIVEWQANRKKESESHFLHLNSGTVVGTKLFCAHSRFPVAPNDCTVEIFDVGGKSLKHEATIRLRNDHGSLTWIDRRDDGSWWMCYAVYGKGSNEKTKLVRYRYEDGRFTETCEWFFPPAVVKKWGKMSCSGGSWGSDGKLYVTGHDRSVAYVLDIDENEELKYIRTEKDLGFFGQAIAWDRFSERPLLWGIVKNQSITKTLVPAN